MVLQSCLEEGEGNVDHFSLGSAYSARQPGSRDLDSLCCSDRADGQRLPLLTHSLTAPLPGLGKIQGCFSLLHTHTQRHCHGQLPLPLLRHTTYGILLHLHLRASLTSPLPHHRQQQPAAATLLQLVLAAVRSSELRCPASQCLSGPLPPSPPHRHTGGSTSPGTTAQTGTGAGTGSPGRREGRRVGNRRLLGTMRL